MAAVRRGQWHDREDAETGLCGSESVLYLANDLPFMPDFLGIRRKRINVYVTALYRPCRLTDLDADLVTLARMCLSAGQTFAHSLDRIDQSSGQAQGTTAQHLVNQWMDKARRAFSQTALSPSNDGPVRQHRREQLTKSAGVGLIHPLLNKPRKLEFGPSIGLHLVVGSGSDRGGG